MATNIQIKRGNAASWTQQNPVLAEGELGLELDTRKMKAGDGVTPWNSLPYSASPNLADYTEDTTHRTVTDNEKALWNAKEDIAKTLVEVTDPAASLQAGKRYHVTVDDGDTFTMSFDATTLAKTDSQAEIAVYIELGEGSSVAGGFNVAIEDEIVESGWYRLVATNDNGTVSAKLYSSSAGGEEIVTEIPEDATAYSLLDNSRYTHKPLSQPTYTLPEITNDKIAHKIVIDIDFTHTQYAEFVSNGTNPVAIDSVSPSEGEVYRMTCRYIAGNWRIGAEKILSTNTIESNTGEIEIEDAVAGKAKSLAMTAPQSVVMNQLAKATDVTTNTSSNGVLEVSDAVAGDALSLKMVAPRSVVVNQTCPEVASNDWSAPTGATFSDNVCTFTATSQYGGVSVLATSDRKQPLVQGHVYAIYCKYMPTTSNTSVRINMQLSGSGLFPSKTANTGGIWNVFFAKGTAGSTGDSRYSFQDTRESGWDEIKFTEPMFIDLTQYFNGDTTLIDSITSWNDLVAYDPRFARYVEYNTGTVEGVQPQVKVTGKNLLNINSNDIDTSTSSPSTVRVLRDGMVLVGFAVNGYQGSAWLVSYSISSDSVSVTTGKQAGVTAYGVGFVMSCIAGRQYTISSILSSGIVSLSWADKDGIIVSYQSYALYSTQQSYTATAPVSAVWLIVILKTATNDGATTTFTKPMVELGSSPTAYEPYHDGGTAQAPAPLFAVGSAADEYDAVSGVTTRNIGVVDMGTLTYGSTYNDSTANPTMYPFGYINFVVPGKKGGYGNCLCAVYGTNTISFKTDKTILGTANNATCYIIDSSFIGKTGTQIAAALSGVYLYYELATPTTSTSTPTQISLQAGANTAMQTDGGRTLAGLAVTCEAGLYNRAIDPTHVYIHYNGVASEIVAGESSIVINGSTDELVDLTQYFGGDSALIASIANWGDLVAYDPTFASAVAYNKGTVAGITPSVKVNDGSAITSPSELFRINTTKNTYDAINGNIVEEAGRINLATLAWTESDGSYSATVSDIKASTSNILLPNGYRGSVSGTTLTIAASESPTGYMVYEKTTATTTDVTPVEVILQQDKNSIVQVDGGRKADPVKVTYECQPSSFDVVTKEDLVPSYVYGIDHDTAIDDETTACKWVLLNHAYDNKDYPAELRYNYVQALGVLPCHDIRRCVMDDLKSRHVNYYLHPDNSNYKADGITPSILTGADGDVMCHVKKAQYRRDTYTDANGHVHNVYLISEKKFNGSKWHTAFRVSKGGASARDQFVGAFRDVLCDAQGNVRDQGTGASPVSYASGNRMRSIAGARPASNTTRANFRAGSVANGANGNINTFMAQYIGLLMAIEGCSFNSQRTVSIGYSNLSAWNYQSMRKTGRTAVLGNHTGEIIADDLTSSGEDYDLLSMASGGGTLWNSAAQSDHSKRVVQCSYRGIEDPIGCMWQFEDGIQKYQNDIIISITVSSVKYTRDVADDVQLPLYCFKNGSTSCYAKSATPSVNDILYSNTTGTSKGTITAVDSENGTVTCGGVVYTRTSASDTNGYARAWLSMSDGTTKKYTWVYNPTSGTVYSDTSLSTSGGSIGSIEADYSQSGFWCTTDTDKYTMLDTSKGYGAQNSKFPSKGYTGPNVVWVSHPWPKLGGHPLKFGPDNFFPTALGGSATKGECDYFYNDAASGARVVFRLGIPYTGGYAGAWHVSVYYSLGYALTYIGGRQTA